MILAVAHDFSSGKMDKTWIRYIRHIDIKTQAILQPILASCQCGGYGLLTQVRKRIHQQSMHKKNQREGYSFSYDL